METDWLLQLFFFIITKKKILGLSELFTTDLYLSPFFRNPQLPWALFNYLFDWLMHALPSPATKQSYFVIALSLLRSLFWNPIYAFGYIQLYSLLTSRVSAWMISIFLSILITSNPSIMSSLLVNMKSNITDLFLTFHCKESNDFQKDDSKRVFAMFPGSWPSLLDLQGDVFVAAVGRIIYFHID